MDSESEWTESEWNVDESKEGFPLKKNKNERFVKFSPPLIGEEEIHEVVDTLKSDWLTTGPKTRAFETEFAAYVQAPGALALNSCTAGLHIALATLGIGPGDEVITTPLTFAASVNVIEHVGATPILVDVEPDTLNIDPSEIEAAITARTRAIIPVHFAGHPVNLTAIRDIAQRHDLEIVEDAAHAIPAQFGNQMIGSCDNPVAFSFYATKNMTTGEGGMLTGTPDFLSAARTLSLHGMSREAWSRYEKGGTYRYDIVKPGFKYNMTDLQAAIGIWQLRKLESFQERRREIVSHYRHELQRYTCFQLPVERPDVSHAWHLFVLRLQTDELMICRDDFISELAQRGVATSVHFIPIFLHSYYRNKYGFKVEDYPVTMANFERFLSLPLNPRMSDDDVDFVISSVIDLAAANQRRRLAA